MLNQIDKPTILPEDSRTFQRWSPQYYNTVKNTGLIATGTIGCGKTDSVKKLTSNLIDDGCNVTIFDTIGNWFYNFRSDVICQRIHRPTDYYLQRKQIIYYLKMHTEKERQAFIFLFPQFRFHI